MDEKETLNEIEKENERQENTSPVPARVPLPQMLLGGLFLTISIGSAAALLAAYLPLSGFGETSSQVAAVEAPQHNDPFKDISLVAKSAYVVDGSNESVLFAKNADAQLPLASITKVMLALVVAEVVPMDATITISRDAVTRGGGGLTYGERWKARDLIDYMLIASSNTAAEALREAAETGIHQKYTQAPESGVIWRMNDLAQSLGMTSTYFLNPSGLDESTTQAGAFGSAKDIATLFSYALRTQRELFAGTSREFATLGPLNGAKKDVHNTNESLANIPHIYMGKTGLTDLAGGNLAIAFDIEENHPVIVVVLGSTQEGRFLDIERLVSASREKLFPSGPSVETSVGR